MDVLKPYLESGASLMHLSNAVEATVKWTITGSATLTALKYCAIPFSNHKQMYPNIRIMKSEKMIFTSRFQIWYFTIAIALAWIAGNFSINF